MRKIALLLVAKLLCSAAFGQNPRWRIADETPIPARADLSVRWEASTTNIPAFVSIYRMLPHRFTHRAVSNAVVLCDFSGRKGETQAENELSFVDRPGGRRLVISLNAGVLHYECAERHYGPEKLAKGVPKMSELPKVATNFLHILEIPLDEVTGFFDDEKFNYSEPLTMFYVGDNTITNIAFRSVKFRRMVDKIPVAGGDDGGFDVGEGGHLTHADLEWHDLERLETRATISSEAIQKLLLHGRTFQGLLPMNVNPIDWSIVKSVTVKKVMPCYFAGRSGLLYPFAVLFTTVDTGHELVDVQIESPIVDESARVQDRTSHP